MIQNKLKIVLTSNGFVIWHWDETINEALQFNRRLGLALNWAQFASRNAVNGRSRYPLRGTRARIISQLMRVRPAPTRRTRNIVIKEEKDEMAERLADRVKKEPLDPETREVAESRYPLRATRARIDAQFARVRPAPTRRTRNIVIKEEEDEMDDDLFPTTGQPTTSTTTEQNEMAAYFADRVKKEPFDPETREVDEMDDEWSPIVAQRLSALDQPGTSSSSNHPTCPSSNLDVGHVPRWFRKGVSEITSFDLAIPQQRPNAWLGVIDLEDKCMKYVLQKNVIPGTHKVVSIESQKFIDSLGQVVDENEHPINTTLWCDGCDKYYSNFCKSHPLFLVKDTDPTTIPSLTLSVAEKTLPSFLELKRSNIKNAGEGVFSKIALPRGLFFGPFKGVKVEEGQYEDDDYCWKIVLHTSSHVLSAWDQNSSNWLRYVNCSASENQQNVMAFQMDGFVYYRTCTPIEAGVELLTWYGDEYGNQLQQGNAGAGS